MLYPSLSSPKPPIWRKTNITRDAPDSGAVDSLLAPGPG